MSQKNAKTPEQELFNKVVLGDIENFKKFIKKYPNVNIDTKNEKGETLLMRAAAVGDDNVVDALADAGANVNAVDNNKDTALIRVARKGNLSTVETLCRKGVDVNFKNKDGKTALMVLAGNNYRDINMRLKIGEYLVNECGADVNIEDNKGRTAFLNLKSSQFKLAMLFVKKTPTENIQELQQEGKLSLAFAKNNRAKTYNVLLNVEIAPNGKKNAVTISGAYTKNAECVFRKFMKPAQFLSI